MHGRRAQFLKLYMHNRFFAVDCPILFCFVCTTGVIPLRAKQVIISQITEKIEIIELV